MLFDLDGTLADSAPDLGGALNQLCQRYQRSPLSLPLLRPFVSQGARGLIQRGFGITPQDPFYDELRDEFLELYEARLCQETRLFSGIPSVLDTLDIHHIPWGIITNKVTRFTAPLVQLLQLQDRVACVISGDTCSRPKPFPDPLLAAAEILRLPPSELVYVGDDERDMLAAQAAGMLGLVAGWGYLGEGLSPPQSWPALGWLTQPDALLDHLQLSL